MCVIFASVGDPDPEPDPDAFARGTDTGKFGSGSAPKSPTLIFALLDPDPLARLNPLTKPGYNTGRAKRPMLQCDSLSTTDRIAVLTIAENPVVLSIYQRGEYATIS